MDRKRGVRGPKSKREQLHLLFELAEAISRQRKPEEIYQTAVRGLINILSVDRAAVLVPDEDGVLRFKAWTGLSQEYRAAAEAFAPSREHAVDATVTVSDVVQRRSPSAYRQMLAKEGIRAFAVIPLLANGNLIGKFVLIYNKPHTFRTEELELAKTVATHVAFVLERTRAENALRESEQRFHAILSQSAVGIAQIRLNGGWLLVNDRYCEILGYTQAELRGMNTRELTHPDDWDLLLEGRRLLMEGEISSHAIEKRYIRKDGSIIWGRLQRSLVRDQHNQPQYFIGVVEEITDRKLAERALRESELLNQQIIDNIPDCIFVLDVSSDGRFRFVTLNPAEEKAAGLTRASVVGRIVDEVLPREVAEKVIAHYRACLEAGTIINYDDELDLPIGRRYFHTNLIPVRNPSGEIFRIVGCCIDVTEVKRRQEETLARQKLESMGVLAAGIAHDFNNLLGGIIASAELALVGLGDASPGREELQRIRTAAIRGGEIVRQLMIYGGKESPAVEPVNVSLLVEEMLHLLRVSISKQATLVTKLNKNIPMVQGNASQIRQVVMNLIINASEAIGDLGGVINVSTKCPRPGHGAAFGGPANLPDQNYVQIEVSDTGAGMTPEVQAKIFDPFFTTKFPGRGLGLAVVHGIVRDHGGAINYVSSPGRGTTCLVWLPCAAKRTLETAMPKATAAPAKIESHGRTILVVEDEELLRTAVSKALRKNGYKVIEAAEGRTVLELIRGGVNEISAILLDATVPGIRSQEILDEAKRTQRDIQVILTSAYSKEAIESSFGGLHVEHFIRKPFQLTELMNMLRTVISESRAQARAGVT